MSKPPPRPELPVVRSAAVPTVLVNELVSCSAGNGLLILEFGEVRIEEGSPRRQVMHATSRVALPIAEIGEVSRKINTLLAAHANIQARGGGAAN